MAKRKGKVGFLGLTNKTWMWVGVGVVGYYLLKPKSTTNGSTGTPSTGPTRNGGGLTTSGSIDTSITGIGATIPRALLKKIEEVNSLLEQAIDLEVYTYAGGTYPYYVSNILYFEVKDKYVYAITDDSFWGKKYGYFDKKQRFNTNNDDQLEELKYALNYIKRALVSAIKKG